MSNNKQCLWQYTVILHKSTTKDGKEIFEGAEMVLEPKYILAKNEKEVIFKATREIPENKTTNPENVEILVRPF